MRPPLFLPEQDGVVLKGIVQVVRRHRQPCRAARADRYQWAALVAPATARVTVTMMLPQGAGNPLPFYRRITTPHQSTRPVGAGENQWPAATRS